MTFTGDNSEQNARYFALGRYSTLTEHIDEMRDQTPVEALQTLSDMLQVLDFSGIDSLEQCDAQFILGQIAYGLHFHDERSDFVVDSSPSAMPGLTPQQQEAIDALKRAGFNA